MLVLRRRRWTPKRLPSLLAWFDARTISAAEAATIATWPDLSGQGRNATEATNKPLFRHSGIKGFPAVDFSGASMKLVSVGVGTVAQPYTVWAVIKYNGTTTDQCLWDSGAVADMVLIRVNASGVWRIQAGTGLDSVVVTDTNPHVVCAVYNGASSILQLDGTTIASGNAGTTGFASGVTLGNYRTGVLPALGRIGEWFAASTTDAGMRVAGTQYLLQRWNF